MWTAITLVDAVGYVNEQESLLFCLQKLEKQESVLKNLWQSVQSVFDVKQPPFRIIMKPLKMVACSEAHKEILENWSWIQEHVVPEISLMDDLKDKEEFAIAKFKSLVEQLNTDEKSTDAKYRAAARSWKQLFRMPDNERFVNYYSCSYHRKLLNQGWLYVSMSYCCFYSSILGTETKVVIEFKEIVELAKDKSKSGMIPDAIRIVMKNKTIHQFSNLFVRDETFELLEYLVHNAMSRLLRSTATDPAPGQSFKAEEAIPEVNYSSPVAVLGLPKEYESLPLKEAFDLQKRNKTFQQMFSLPFAESISFDIPTTCSVTGTSSSHPGTLFLSPTFLCFASNARHQSQLSIPCYAIMKVERISSATSTVSITARHGLKLIFQLLCDKSTADNFCNLLRGHLQKHVEMMKLLKPFLLTCPSEDLLNNRDGSISGLGAKFGYIDATKFEIT